MPWDYLIVFCLGALFECFVTIGILRALAKPKIDYGPESYEPAAASATSKSKKSNTRTMWD